MPIQQKVWNIGAAVGIILAIYLIALAVGAFKSIAYIGSGVPATNTISVSGTGDAYAIPDVATFSFTVTQNAKTVTVAQSQATDKINTALKAVRDAGVADKDIQTTSYSINPHYEYNNAVCPTSAAVAPSVSSASGVTSAIYCPSDKSVLTGYDVSQTITVKVRNLDKAGAIFASIGSLEVENVNGLDFSVDKPDVIQAQARATAISDAQSKGKTLAQQLGVHLVRIVSFSENNNSSPRPAVMYAMSASADSKSVSVPEIPAGQQKVTDNVTITYEIE